MERKEVDAEGREMLDVLPVSKGRRMLLFLGDFFVAFILALFLCNIVAFPIAEATSNLESRNATKIQNEQSRFAILYENNLLFYESSDSKNQTEINLEYSYSRFLSYYVVDGPIGDEIFHTYYSQYENQDGKSLIDQYKGFDKLSLFDYDSLDENGCPALKEKYASGFAPAFDENDSLSGEMQKDYDDALETFFLPMYYQMMEDIRHNDLYSPDGTPSWSYNELTAMIEDYNDFYDMVAITTAYASLSLSCIIMYFVYPLANKKGRTLTQSVMKIERIDSTNFKLLPWPIRLISGAFMTILTLSCVLFVPIPTIDVNYVFSLPALLSVSIISLFAIVAAFICVLADKYNRGLTEIFTHSVDITEETLDEIYRAKGYYV